MRTKAAELDLELLFLPAYSPNLNLIERKRHGKHRVKRAECETWDGRASHVYGQDCTDIEAR